MFIQDQKSIYLCFVLLAALVSCCAAQNYISPKYESKANRHVELGRVEVTQTHTILHLLYVAPTDYEKGGWACIMREAHLKDAATGKCYGLLKAENIPICEVRRHYFQHRNEYLYFRLYFEKIPVTTRIFHFIESNADNNPFNFYKIFLKPVA